MQRPLELLPELSSAPEGAWRPLVLDEDRRLERERGARLVSSQISVPRCLSLLGLARIRQALRDARDLA